MSKKARAILMMTLFILVCFALAARGNTLTSELEGGGVSITNALKPGVTRYHSATGTVSLDNAINVTACKGGLDIWFNPDFDGTNTTATYTLFNCPRETVSASYASECIGANFDPDGGGANTNVMQNSDDSLHLWNLRIRFFGATITAGADTAQATILCN